MTRTARLLRRMQTNSEGLEGAEALHNTVTRLLEEGASREDIQAARGELEDGLARLRALLQFDAMQTGQDYFPENLGGVQLCILSKLNSN